MDEMAIGITNYILENHPKIPIVVRMSGTKQEEGRQILAAGGVEFFDDLSQAIEAAVKVGRSDS